MARREEGITWDEASPELRRIVAKNQLWAEANGYAPKGSPEHYAARRFEGAKDSLMKKYGKAA